MENNSTHFVFDGKNIVISPDLHLIIIFLQEIEKEIESFLGFDKQLESIRKQYLETINFVQFLADKLKENSINFNYTLSESPEKIGEKLKIDRPIRSEMIVLFAYLEVLFRFNCAYENKTFDDNEIRKLAMNQDITKTFIKNFCLNPKNEWGKNNPDRLKHITVDNLRRLRNSLTHFFSVNSGLSVVHSQADEKARKLEEATHFKAVFISPEDLYGIIKGVAKLMIEEWSDDCKKCIVENSDDFKEKILCIKNLVNNTGSIVIKNGEINI